MPLYEFRNIETNEVFEKSMAVSDREIYLQENSHIKQIHTSGINAVSDAGLKNRVPDGMRDLLRGIKKANRGANFDTH